MCGIAGVISPRGFDPAVLAEMASAIRHRGPDGEGYLTWAGGDVAASPRPLPESPRRESTVGLAHLRLAIIDLREVNAQPLVDADRSLAVVFNGEIYNYVELREELQAVGHKFETTGDTEVLLAAYAEWGSACVERFVGMWAFALLDGPRRRLFFSRDRFGIKPLYYCLSGGALYFASEIKALLAVPSIGPLPHEAAVRRFLLTGATDESERTFFEGIRSLPPAHNMAFSLDEAPAPKPERYWRVPPEGYAGDRLAAAGEFERLLTESVRLHARSDVPVGTCLSGGLDSAAIVCVADGLRRSGAIPSYAHSGFGYLPDDPAYSERAYMEEVVQATGLEMTYVEAEPRGFADALVEISRSQDEPFASTSVGAQWFVFRAARAKGMKVMLDGQGADEMLAGYHGYFSPIARALLRSRQPIRYARFARAHRREHGVAPLSVRAALAAFAAGRKGSADVVVPGAPADLAMLSPALRARVQGSDTGAAAFGSVHELLAAQMESLGLPSLLRFEDRNSMAHSIEARVPFLDHRLVEFAFSLPTHFKLDGVETKAVMRQALRDLLPARIRERSDKVGFRAEPSATWQLAERHRDSLRSSRTEFEASWLAPGAVEALLDEGDRSALAEFRLWRLINLKLWLRAFWGDGSDPLD